MQHYILQFVLLLALIGVIVYFKRKDQKKRAAARAELVKLDLPQSMAFHNYIVARFCRRASANEKIWAEPDFIGYVHGHIEALAGRRTDVTHEKLTVKNFVRDAAAILRKTGNEQEIRAGLKNYFYAGTAADDDKFAKIYEAMEAAAYPKN